MQQELSDIGARLDPENVNVQVGWTDWEWRTGQRSRSFAFWTNPAVNGTMFPFVWGGGRASLNRYLMI